MTLPRVVPPPDLLAQIEGIEKALQQGRRLGKVGRGAFLASAGWTAVAVVTSVKGNPPQIFDWSAAVGHWLLVGAVLVLALSILWINWLRFWISESKRPFRYTYSIDAFEPVETSARRRVSWVAREGSAGLEPTEASEVQPDLAWLRQDLSERLSERIGRLSLLDERYSGTAEGMESHLHIGGSYGIRQISDGRWLAEVTPWIRLGPHGSPATLAHPVKFNLGRDARGQLVVEDYEKLRERIYFSIATHLYRQIKRDVQHKIELLPKRYFRAVAYFYEADDYLSSNTLDAYDQASELYAEAIRLYDPRSWDPSRYQARRLLQRIAALRVRSSLVWRRAGARVWPRLGRVELMVAKAEIGYARALLYRRTLAGMSGQRLNPIFAARPVAERAVTRLRKLEGVPGQRESIFDGLVTLASAYSLVGSARRAREHLGEARCREPMRADQDARYLYVQGLVETGRPFRFFRRAVELEPTFEVAQFELAVSLEMFWRARPTLEPSVAELVAKEYDDLLTVNPGNISAWANLGYMRWLLGDLAKAKQAFERGREYKQIVRKTFVAEMDYGLARVAAEQGDFNTAYEHYISAVSAQFDQGVWHAPRSPTQYQFERMTRKIVERFERYRRDVERHWSKLRGTGTDELGTTERVRDAVYAFVANDYAEACFNYYLRSSDERFEELARRSLEGAVGQVRTRYPMLYFNLHRFRRPGSAGTGEHIERVVGLEPDWFDGKLEHVLWNTSRAREEWDESSELRKRASELRGEADALLTQAREKEHEARRTLFERLLTESDEGETPQSYWLKLLEQSPALGGSQRASEQEVRQLEQQADEKRREAAERLRRAWALRRRSWEWQERAVEAAKTLLPHTWLWKDGRFDWRVLDRRDLRRTRTWERELDDLHARGLFAWCQVFLGRQDWPPERGRLDPRALFARWSTRVTRERVRALLDHIRGHYWPDDFDVLRAYAEFDDKPADWDDSLRSVIRDWVETDPAYWALTWVDDERFGPTDIVRMLEKASRQPQTPDFLALWIGDRLTEREAGTAALEAYEKAAVSSDPEVLYRLGERLRERGELERSLEAFERASEIDAGRVDSPPEHHPDEYRRAIGEALWKLGHHDEAVAKFSAIAEQPVALGDRWRTSLVWSLSTGGSVRTADSYRLLKDWLGRELTVAQRSEWAARGAGDDSAVSRFQERRRDAAEAILLLTRDRYQQLVRRPLDGSFSALSEGMTPTVLPIALQAHQSFFPNADATPEVARMVDEEIPALQARVKSATGVTIPPVYILSVQDLRPGEYKLLIDEVALGGGLLGGERSFAPDGGTCRALGIGGRDDATSLPGMAGVWLPHDERADSARAAGLEVWDAYTFMLRHLETLLLRNLEAFLGVEEVGDLLRGWAEPLAIVEAPQDLLPDGGETAEVARLRSTELPNVRTRVWDETGVLVREPEFRVGERLETGEYRLLLDDVAVDAGRLGEEPFFCPDGEACRRRQLEGRSAPAPLDGAEGMWLNEDDEARRQELEVWDRHTYMLRHMEAVLARRLRERRRLHSHALPDERSLVRLAAVLQGLVTEGVPISDVDTILAEFANAPRSAEIYAVVERVRSVLRAELPGTVGSDRLVGLEPGFEDEVARWTQTRDGRHFLALPPQRAQVLRQLLEQQIAGVDETHCALVVRRRDLRPFVRRLTELGHPTLPVVAVGELPEDRFPPELLRGRGPSGGG